MSFTDKDAPPPYPGLQAPKSRFAMHAPSGGGTVFGSGKLPPPSDSPPAPVVHKPWAKGEPLTWDIIKTRNTKKELWVVIQGRVYDVTEYRVHPGGMYILERWGGQDATVQFDRYHSMRAREYLREFYIGDVVNDVGAKLTIGYTANAPGQRSGPVRRQPGPGVGGYPPPPTVPVRAAPPPPVPASAAPANETATEIPPPIPSFSFEIEPPPPALDVTRETEAPPIIEVAIPHAPPAPVVVPAIAIDVAPPPATPAPADDGGYTLTCVSRERATPEGVLLTLTVGGGVAGPPTATPLCGHVRLFTPDGGSRRYTPVAESVVGAAQDQYEYQFYIKAYTGGAVSPHLCHDVHRGDVVRMAGPEHPERWRFNPDTRVYVLVAGGTGITPFLRLLDAVKGCGCEVLLYWGNRRPSDVPTAIARQLATHAHVRVVHSLSDVSAENIAAAEARASADADADADTPTRVAWHAGRIDEALLRSTLPLTSVPEHTEALVCGPEGFNDAVSSALLRLGHRPVVLD